MFRGFVGRRAQLVRPFFKRSLVEVLGYERADLLVGLLCDFFLGLLVDQFYGRVADGTEGSAVPVILQLVSCRTESLVRFFLYEKRSAMVAPFASRLFFLVGLAYDSTGVGGAGVRLSIPRWYHAAVYGSVICGNGPLKSHAGGTNWPASGSWMIATGYFPGSSIKSRRLRMISSSLRAVSTFISSTRSASVSLPVAVIV